MKLTSHLMLNNHEQKLT